ncbi:MAG: hypothetical protein HKN76_15105, partial [Saprospiraceae bacterium]|nr:hypothetical protein [Saprospiraceae bacterium]
MSRRLCAIMFTDIQGYTRLMQESEKSAVAVRHKHRSIFDPLTKQFGGEIIQYYGDGTLSIFDSTVKAVECAQALQTEFLKEPAIPVRIGIHTGDIIITEDDIIGDSVNLASRIESLGVPGSVLVSGKVADEIRSQEHLPLQKIGSFHFKNDSLKRQVFALDLPGFSKPDIGVIQGKLEDSEKKKTLLSPFWKTLIYGGIAGLVIFLLWNVYQASFSATVGKQLAVLPFTNLANDPAQSYLVDGIHEAIISELLQAGIDVKPKTTMTSYRNTGKSPGKIAQELNVNVLVEGSVLRQDDAIQITISLLDGLGDKYLWSDTYDSEMTDLMVLYRDVTRSIAGEIQVALAPQVEARLSTVTKLNPEAYDLYLRGREQFNLGTAENLQRAVTYYEESMAIDPEFDPIYTALIETYLLMGFGGIDPYEAHTNFRISMEKAMSHNPDLKADHHLQAMIKIFSDWDWTGAEKD